MYSCLQTAIKTRNHQLITSTKTESILCFIPFCYIAWHKDLLYGNKHQCNNPSFPAWVSGRFWSTLFDIHQKLLIGPLVRVSVAPSVLLQEATQACILSAWKHIPGPDHVRLLWGKTWEETTLLWQFCQSLWDVQRQLVFPFEYDAYSPNSVCTDTLAGFCMYVWSCQDFQVKFKPSFCSDLVFQDLVPPLTSL